MEPLQQHFLSALQPLPQHFCWDCGQQTCSPHKTQTDRWSTEKQITPPFISILVFHLLLESYPLFPPLSQTDKHRPRPLAIFINTCTKALTLTRARSLSHYQTGQWTTLVIKRAFVVRLKCPKATEKNSFASISICLVRHLCFSRVILH